jgi:hypothetical protein
MGKFKAISYHTTTSSSLSEFNSGNIKGRKADPSKPGSKRVKRKTCCHEDGSKYVVRVRYLHEDDLA